MRAHISLVATLFLATGTAHQSAQAQGVGISAGRTAGEWKLVISPRGECGLEKLWDGERQQGVIVWADIPHVEEALERLKSLSENIRRDYKVFGA